MDYIALAIPAFFLLMAVELLFSKVLKKKVYRFNDSMGDLFCGITQQAFKVVIGLFSFLSYKYLYTEHRILEISSESIVAWIVLFLGVDFCYYWFHRLSHELNFLWAAHVVHHQSEEYNLSVALRQSALQSGFSWAFYLPLALIGFPPLMFIIMASFNTLYQFWIHTRLIKRLGPLEWFLNTPSHHRVHHGSNPQYIDRNHAGTLIIWDRMFGTFEPEGEEVIYGVTEPLDSFNPLKANLQVWQLSFRRMLTAKYLKDKVLIWFKGPCWVPEGAEGLHKAPPGRGKYDPQVSSRLKYYIFVQFLLLTAAIVGFLFLKTSEAPVEKVVLGLSIWGTAITLGGLLDGQAWARAFEWVRTPLLAALVLALVPTWQTAPILGVVGAASLLFPALLKLTQLSPSEVSPA